MHEGNHTSRRQCLLVARVEQPDVHARLFDATSNWWNFPNGNYQQAFTPYLPLLVVDNNRYSSIQATSRWTQLPWLQHDMCSLRAENFTFADT